MKSFKEFISLETKETRYTPFVIRVIIELIIFGGLDVLFFIIIPTEIKSLRLIVVLFFILTLISVFAFVIRCIGVSDNRAKINNKKEHKKASKAIAVNRDDFIFWLKNAELYEELVIKSLDGKTEVLDVTPEKKKTIYYFADKEYSFNALINKLEEEEYLNDVILVCQTYEGNKPDILVKIIEDLKKKHE